MERRGNTRRNWKRVSFLLLIMALGLLSVAAICVLAYFSYEVAVGSRDYCMLWTDIPGRFANFLIGYYVAGVCGCLPIPERWRLSWLPQPFFVLWRLQSWKKLVLGIYLLSFLFMFLRRRMNDSETPLLREGPLHDSPPGPSGAGTVCNQDAARSPTEAVGMNRKSNGSIRTSSADSASQLLEGKDEEESCDSSPAIPKPSRSIDIGDQDKSGIKRPDASRSSNVSFGNSPTASALPHPRDQNEEKFYDIPLDFPASNESVDKSFDLSTDDDIVPMAEKESPDEKYSDSDQFDSQESRPLRMCCWPLRRKIHPRGRSRTTPANFSWRRKLIPVRRRSASDRSRQLADRECASPK